MSAGDDHGVLVVLPARFASTRLPGKPLLSATGKYVVQHAWERAKRLATATAVIVATDDERIAAAVRSFGGDVAMTSPECATGSDRVAEVARTRSEPLVVNLQADEPEFDVDAVDALVRAMQDDASLPLGTLAAVAEPGDRERPSVVKVVCDRRGRALYFSRAAVPHHRDVGPEHAPTLRHVGVYVFRREALLEFTRLPQTPLEMSEKLEQLRALEHGWPIRVTLSRAAPPGIDTREDYEAFVRRASVSAGKGSA